MKCKYETCSNESQGSSAYCSNSCRAKESKRNRTGATIEAQPGQTEAQPQAQPSQAQPKFIIASGMVYSRAAVRYEGDQWPTRPAPIDSDDQPHPGGRGKYTRQDGSVYQFDCNGNDFEVTNGKVYQSIEEVKACYAGVGHETG